MALWKGFNRDNLVVRVVSGPTRELILKQHCPANPLFEPSFYGGVCPPPTPTTQAIIWHCTGSGKSEVCMWLRYPRRVTEGKQQVAGYILYVNDIISLKKNKGKGRQKNERKCICEESLVYLTKW